ncbi:unnamed protein product [Dibothriocephalus latus]|uniref:Uncharacterized protein n=1 Tax=Dibothriocephalus latus TaxID=60516 RepID=A0A3P7LGX0_DIBLA|nr:unnamed protein product [Dibothriocephalus latus]
MVPLVEQQSILFDGMVNDFDQCLRIYRKLENVLRKPIEQVEVLQDELMRVKLREAEGLLQMKELRQRLNEIQSLWEDHCGRRKASKPPDVQGFLRTSTGLLQSKILGKSSNSELDVQHLSDRILEAKYLTQIADLQQKVKELTAHEELASRQASRHDDMLASLQDKLDSSLLREASLIAELKQAECGIVDVEAKVSYHSYFVRTCFLPLVYNIICKYSHFAT